LNQIPTDFGIPAEPQFQEFGINTWKAPCPQTRATALPCQRCQIQGVIGWPPNHIWGMSDNIDKRML
jgi:hypothetical protein